MRTVVSDATAQVRRALAKRIAANAAADPNQAAADCEKLAGILEAEAASGSVPTRGRFLAEAAQSYRRLAQELRTRKSRPKAARAVADQEPQARVFLSERPCERLADVVGLEDAKAELRRAVILPLEHPDARELYRPRLGGGVLLYGPPGNGKTLLARAIAGELGWAFLQVRPSEIFSKYVGESEANLAALFAEARRHERVVVFIDELESIAPPRADETSEVSRRVVTQALQELSDLPSDADRLCLLLAATNYPWMVDEALLRMGRFRRHVYVRLPDEGARRELLRLGLAGRPTAEGLDLCRIAVRTEGYSAAELTAVCDGAAERAMEQYISTGRKVLIDPPRLLEETKLVTPSVTPQTLAQCEAWAGGARF